LHEIVPVKTSLSLIYQNKPNYFTKITLFLQKKFKPRHQAMGAFYSISMKEIPTRRKTVTSSSNETLANQLGKRLLDRYLKTTWKFSTSDS
jgi:hypothetical protein